MMLGAGLAGMIGKSFVDEHGRRLVPYVVAAALLCGSAIAWALNAWWDYVQLTAHGGGSM